MPKPTKWPVRPAKTQISLGIGPVWSESSLYFKWVAKDPRFLDADSEDWSDWAAAHADPSLHLAHTPFCWFCHAVAYYRAAEMARKWRNNKFEPRHEKTCLRGLRPGETQTSMHGYRSLLETWIFWFSMYKYYAIMVMNNKDYAQADLRFFVRIWHQQVFLYWGSNHSHSTKRKTKQTTHYS